MTVPPVEANLAIWAGCGVALNVPVIRDYD
jgi:hypothetical protein